MNEGSHTHTSPVGEVLIADDDEDFRSLLVRRAHKMGLCVTEASDGTQAIARLQGQSFDVLIVDLYMPGCSGLEVVHAAHAIDPDSQAVILTASASLDSALEALRAGVYDYLTKPLESLTIFELTIARALERRFLIQENQRLFEEVQRLAITDPLTGLYNRHKLHEVLDHEIERARRYDRPLTAIMLDMDRMKTINDSFGHAAGDQAIQMVADAIRNSVRKLDLPVRVGGDEFLILLPEADLRMAGKVARRIHEIISQRSCREIDLAVSIGVGQWHSNYRSSEGFLDIVDKALYQAKQASDERILLLEPGEVPVA